MADQFCAANRSQNTLTSYAHFWKAFQKWCLVHDRTSLPALPDTVLLWAAWLIHEGRKVATASAQVAGVAFHHREAGYTSPVDDKVRLMLSGARRTLRESPVQKKPLTVDQLRAISLALSNGYPLDTRDRALFVLGFAGAFRRSELRSLDVGDVHFEPAGLLIHLKWSKTDQEAKGRDVAIFAGARAETCPVRTLEAWLQLRGIEPGPLFTSSSGYHFTNRRMGWETIGQVFIRGLKRIGLDPHQYSGHSLRAGFVTAAAENGATQLSVMKHTGHRSVEMVHRYFRSVEAFRTNPLVNLL